MVVELSAMKEFPPITTLLALTVRPLVTEKNAVLFMPRLAPLASDAEAATITDLLFIATTVPLKVTALLPEILEALSMVREPLVAAREAAVRFVLSFRVTAVPLNVAALLTVILAELLSSIEPPVAVREAAKSVDVLSMMTFTFVRGSALLAVKVLAAVMTRLPPVIVVVPPDLMYAVLSR